MVSGSGSLLRRRLMEPRTAGGNIMKMTGSGIVTSKGLGQIHVESKLICLDLLVTDAEGNQRELHGDAYYYPNGRTDVCTVETRGIHDKNVWILTDRRISPGLVYRVIPPTCLGAVMIVNSIGTAIPVIGWDDLSIGSRIDVNHNNHWLFAGMIEEILPVAQSLEIGDRVQTR